MTSCLLPPFSLSIGIIRHQLYVLFLWVVVIIIIIGDDSAHRGLDWPLIPTPLFSRHTRYTAFDAIRSWVLFSRLVAKFPDIPDYYFSLIARAPLFFAMYGLRGLLWMSHRNETRQPIPKHIGIDNVTTVLALFSCLFSCSFVLMGTHPGYCCKGFFYLFFFWFGANKDIAYSPPPLTSTIALAMSSHVISLHSPHRYSTILIYTLLSLLHPHCTPPYLDPWTWTRCSMLYYHLLFWVRTGHLFFTVR